MAESERFELSVQYHRTHAFQACSFNHSDTSPKRVLIITDYPFGARFILDFLQLQVVWIFMIQ